MLTSTEGTNKYKKKMLEKSKKKTPNGTYKVKKMI